MQPAELGPAHAPSKAAEHATLRAFSGMLIRVLPRQVLTTLILIVLAGAMELTCLLLLIPLLGLIGLSAGGGAASRLAEVPAAAFALLGVRPRLVSVLTIYVGLSAVRALLQRRQSLAMTELQGRFVVHLRQRLFQAVLQSRWLFFSRQRGSDFLHVLTDEITRVGYATDHLLPLLSQSLLVLIYLLFAFTLSPAMTLLVFAAGSAIILLLRSRARKAMAAGELTAAATRRMYGAVMEHVAGLKVAKSYGAEERTARFFERLQTNVAASHLEAQRNFTLVRASFDIGAVLVLSLMLYVSVEVMALAVAEVLLLVFLFGRVVPRLSGLQQSYQYFINTLPAFRDVVELINACEAEREQKGDRATAPQLLNDVVRLRQVCFSYRSDSVKPALRNIDLEIPAHQTTAIVGPSGAGKSTIADLVLGLIFPDAGQLLIDETRLGPETLAAWRRQIGYVPQDAFLFHDTIRANLLWAEPGATEADLWEALRLAAADRFVRQLPRGLDTCIGDRGVLLAGGERQRLALARALLRKPAILVLDEATSALDSENERRIQRAIESLHGAMTILLITHRLSTIREADAIHVIEDGRIVEAGTWPDLIAANGRFVDLCRAQRITLGTAMHGGLVSAMA